MKEAKVKEITRLGTGNEPKPILLKLNDAQTQRKVLSKAKLQRNARSEMHSVVLCDCMSNNSVINTMLNNTRLMRIQFYTLMWHLYLKQWGLVQCYRNISYILHILSQGHKLAPSR